MPHDHAHAKKRYNRAFAVGVVLNVVFVIIELVCGIVGDSLALIADAGHNLSDVLSLLLAWGAFLIAEKAPTRKFTYRLRKATILAALLSAVVLLIALGAIGLEALRRFGEARKVDGAIVLVVAGVGVVINTATAWLFYADRKHDLNIKGAFLHLAADAAVSLGVVVAAVLILATDWLWLDPALSLVIVAIILIGTWALLRDSLGLSLDAAPRTIDLEAVETWLQGQPGVVGLHHLHVWAMSTTQTALTVHLVMPQGAGDDDLQRIAEGLETNFAIEHCTLQVERSDAHCASSCEPLPSQATN